VLVIAGTGSIAYGRNAAGETGRAGGWGHTVSDEGSGYWIGIEAVKAALCQHDAQRHSALLSALVMALGVNEFDDFIVRINADPQPDYAALFPVAQQSAEQGDTVALAVLEHAAEELADLTQVLITRLFQEAPVEIAIYGGVFTASTQLRESFWRTVEGFVPHALLSSKVVDAARGALNHARDDQTIS
jgi:N-acetylglucosamine kinase-like BadF-type ATPase